MHEGKEIEIRVDRKSSRSWKSQLQWIWNDDSDCFTNVKGFPVTGYVNRCPIHNFKSLKSMNLLRHGWRKRNGNKLKEILPGTENHNFYKFEMTILIVLQMSRVSLLQDILIDV